MHIRALCKPALALSLAAACQWAQAQAFDAVRLYGVPEGDSAGIVGVVVLETPQYLGSNERRFQVLPSFNYQWKNGWFAGLSNGIGYDFQSRPDMQYGFRITADIGRKESRSNELSGMGSVQPRPEAGLFFNYLPSPELFFTSSLRYGAGNDRNGMLLDLGAGYGKQFAASWRGVVGVAATYVNGNYMQAYFGVTPQQSAASGYAVYSPGAGFRDVRLNASLTYFIDRRWSVTGALTVSSLQGDARTSPIVFENTPVSGVVAVSYSF
jgi:outer membrane scaffolding protein for murein synthesis (MipA/OmpV family)